MKELRQRGLHVLSLTAKTGWFAQSTLHGNVSAEESVSFNSALRDVAWKNQLRASKRLMLFMELVVPLCVLLEGAVVLFFTVAVFSPLVSLMESCFPM